MKVKFLKESHKRRLTESKKLKSKKLKEAVGEDEFQAYITNLGAYNDGELRGEWVTFPIDEDDFDEILEKIGCNEPGYEEWFVTDYECDCDAQGTLGEYPSLEQLNEFAEMIEDDAFKALLDYLDFEDAKSTFESGDYTFYGTGIDDWSDYAYELVESTGGVESLDKSTLENYFDYEKLGRDLDIEYYQADDDMPETVGEYWCGDEDASDYDIGYECVEQLGIDGISNPEYYFDYDAFGRDLSIEESGGPTEFGFIVFY